MGGGGGDGGLYAFPRSSVSVWVETSQIRNVIDASLDCFDHPNSTRTDAHIHIRTPCTTLGYTTAGARHTNTSQTRTHRVRKKKTHLRDDRQLVTYQDGIFDTDQNYAVHG